MARSAPSAMRSRLGNAEAKGTAVGRHLGGDSQNFGEAVGKTRRGIVAGASYDRHEQAAVLLGLRRKRLAERNGPCAFRAGLGQNHSLGRARLDSGPRVGPAAFDDRIGADRAQRLDNIARRTVGNNGERTLQRHCGWNSDSGGRALRRSAVNANEA